MNIGIDFDKFQKQEVAQVMTNYTRMPNLLIDDCIMAQISDKAFKCLMFVMRQTVGFNRASHTIAITQFQKYCGIKKEETVARVIRELEQCKLISVERKTGCLNTYTLTINQYHETVLPPSKGGTPNQGGGTTPTEQGYTTPMKRGTIKETLKENIKESSCSGFSGFETQIRDLRFIEYHTQDRAPVSFKNLCQKYAVEQDFKAQAKVSFPHHSEQQIQDVFSDLCQWSLSASNHIPQKWMSIWLDFMKREPTEVEKQAASKRKKVAQCNSHSKPKTALQATKDQWAEERFAQQQTSTVIDVNQDQILIGGERGYF